LTTQANWIDLSRRSKNYELRLYKPGLEKEKIKKFEGNYYWWGRRKESGLGLLCLLEWLWLVIAHEFEQKLIAILRMHPEMSRHKHQGTNFDIDEEIFRHGDHGEGARPSDPDRAISDYDAVR
jgi:hypothetical protein